MKVTDNDSRSFTKALTLNVLAMYPLTANANPAEGGTIRTILGRRYHLLIFPATDSVNAERVLGP